MTWCHLPPHGSWNKVHERSFVEAARSIGRARVNVEVSLHLARREVVNNASLRAGILILADLKRQGWRVRVQRGSVFVEAPTVEKDRFVEKDRVRRQELLKRDEQLRQPSVRRFIAEMERPREFAGELVSIYSLMRDGRELAKMLTDIALDDADARHATLRSLIDPYVQIVHGRERCAYTGLRLMDIWRYFRHTWANQYTSTPGRSMCVLVRDRAAPFHPVIGIAALSSSVVQIRERDEWIGWQPVTAVAQMASTPTVRDARWVVRRLDEALSEIYVDDLLADGLFWPALWDSPSFDAAVRLEKEAEVRRRDHHRFVRRGDLKSNHAPDALGWIARAESDLFRSKRCLALAELLRAKDALLPYLYPAATRDGLRRALADPGGRKAIMGIVRRAKAVTVGTEIADLSVCGAIAPYNKLLGGKLVSMLAVSPSIVRAYHERYSRQVSEIASALAGRPITRKSNLVYVGTTSLYGSGSSQYNRLRMPAEALGGTKPVEFRRIGMSQSFGTSHLSAETVRALVMLSEQSRNGVRVNSIFGEGVNPKMRKVRDGLDLLGWPSQELGQHGRQRIVYGVSLVTNLLAYLLGVDDNPRYIFRQAMRDDAKVIADWWTSRWLSQRVASKKILTELREDILERPVRHGARVSLPPAGPDGEEV